jgi:hypothetical protein
LGCAAGAAGASEVAGDCANTVADDSSANALANPAMNRNMFDPPDETFLVARPRSLPRDARALTTDDSPLPKPTLQT